MPHKTINSYPVVGEERILPVFLRAVGCYEHQPIEDYPEGNVYHLIYFVEWGELILHIRHSSFILKEGMGFFLHRNTPYRIERKTPRCMTHFIIWGCNCEASLFSCINFKNHVIFPSLNAKELKMQLKKMYLLSTEDTFYSKCQNSALLYSCIMDIYTQNEIYKEQTVDSDNTALLLAKRYIEQYYSNDLSLEVLSEFTHVSPQHLCRLFQKYMKMRPTHYINLIRIRIAKQKLQTTEKTISEIAEEVGYHSSFYFSNIFKKLEGISPSAYRKLVRT